jgi:hypothetical protein
LSVFKKGKDSIENSSSCGVELSFENFSFRKEVSSFLSIEILGDNKGEFLAVYLGETLCSLN